MNKEVRQLVAQLDRIPDVAVQTAGSGHLVVTKGGAFVTTLPSTPSDVRWRDNALASLRRAGITPGVRQPKRSMPPKIRQMDARAELRGLISQRQLAEFARFAQQLGEIRGLRTFKNVNSAESSLGSVAHGGGMSAWGWVLLTAALVEWRRRQPEPEVVEQIARSVDVPIAEQSGVKLVVDLDRLVAKLAEFGIDLEVK